jgi:hypothetical protein
VPVQVTLTKESSLARFKYCVLSHRVFLATNFTIGRAVKATWIEPGLAHGSRQKSTSFSSWWAF